MKSLLINFVAAFSFLSVCAYAQQSTDQVPVNPARVIVWGGACFGQEGTGTFSIYRNQTDTVPVWQETQPLTGSALFVGNVNGGLPSDIFSNGDAGWLELVCNGDTVNVQPRRALTASPYAMSAVDSANLGGRPASDYALASQVNNQGSNSAVTAEVSRAQQAEDGLAQQVATETTARQNAIATVQLNEVANMSQVNAAIAALQAQIADLRAANDALSAQVAQLTNSIGSTSNQSKLIPEVAGTVAAKTTGNVQAQTPDATAPVARATRLTRGTR